MGKTRNAAGVSEQVLRRINRKGCVNNTSSFWLKKLRWNCARAAVTRDIASAICTLFTSKPVGAMRLSRVGKNHDLKKIEKIRFFFI